MKNDLLGFTMKRCSDIDERLPSYSDLLELIVMNKIQDGDFDDIAEQMTAALGYDDYDDYDEDSESSESDNSLVNERLTNELLIRNEHSELISAGYTDCMDEAIRFLIEEENISPEHPVVRNLKAHLEQSKDRILQTATEIDLQNNNRLHHNTDNYRLLDTSSIEELQRHYARESVFYVNSQSSWNTG